MPIAPLMPTALPLDAAEHHNLEPDATRAYNVCRDFEEHAAGRDNDRNIMHARILGYLIIYSPSLTAQREVVKVIHSCCNDHASLSALGSAFLDYYISPFKGFRRLGRTPEGSSNSSLLSFDEANEEMLEIKEAPKTHTEAKKQALIRDGYRCIATGLYDDSPNLGITDDEIIADGGACTTKCTHIVPDSMYLNVINRPDQQEYAASVQAVLNQFGYDVESINFEKVHSLYNVMTMDLQSYDLFDQLELSFEATASPNCYKIQKSKVYHTIKDEVTFTTTDPELPLPSPHLLALHAACAKVAQLSGASEFIDRDMETISVFGR